MKNQGYWSNEVVHTPVFKFDGKLIKKMIQIATTKLIKVKSMRNLNRVKTSHSKCLKNCPYSDTTTARHFRVGNRYVYVVT